MSASHWNAFLRPVEPDARRTVAEAWSRLSPELRVDHQAVGRQEEGCGATIGLMPRCDFGCTGCYLGAGANTAEAVSLDEAMGQMRLLRERLGIWGNLQFTDGEVLLRPVGEIIELLKYARKIRLVPMIMTHGDHFRRQPGLLEQLMVEGGLVELSIHIDTTQRGRLGEPYRRARREAELMPLRDEFARMIRAARARTKRPLRVASTVTVTRGNLGEVRDIVTWFVRNADAFRLVSFQPAAQIATPIGQQRLENCIFTVPVDGRIVPMCEVNAGLRDRFYARALINGARDDVSPGPNTSVAGAARDPVGVSADTHSDTEPLCLQRE